jgi:possible relaxase
MQVIMKIAEKQRKTRAGLRQIFDYISRDSFKTYGTGVSDKKEIAFKQFLLNKDLYDKNKEGKDRFTYHQILSFGADVAIEKVIDIMLEYCEENFYKKGFNSFFAIHTDTDNIHCHVIADNVNFNTGDMIHSVTQKQFDSMSQKKKEKNETFVYEHQRKLFEDICIKNGLNISDKERYEYMHEQKVKEGRTWLSKEQYRAGKDKDSWRNILKDKLEQIYKNEDITEDNIKDITNKYGLEVTRHNKTNKTITFAITDEQGKKQRIKLERLSAQEKELNRDSTEENIFIYDNFFKVKEKEKEQEEERKREQEKAKREQEEKIRLEQEKIKKQREERARAEAEERERLEREKKEAEAEKERLERIEKAKLEEFYRKQQEEKEKEIARQKALEEELKEKARLEAEARANAEKERLRLEQEERAREQEAKAKRQAEEKARLERERQAELERLRLEQEEKERLERERQEREERARAEAEEKARLERERQAELERLRLEQEEKERLERERQEQEEKHDLESKQVDLDSLIEKIDSYELAEKYDLYDTLPAFQVIQEDIIYDSSSGEGDIYLAKSLIIDVKGEEYWDNMNVKDITKWENTGLFTIYYTDSMDNFKEYQGYEDYSKSTIKQFLKENRELAEELAKEYMQEQDSNSKTKDSKDYEVEKKKDREIDFN